MNVIYGLSTEVEVLRSGQDYVSVDYDQVKHPFVPFIVSGSGVVDLFSNPNTPTITIGQGNIISTRSMGARYSFRTQFGSATPQYNTGSLVQVFNPAPMIPDKMTYLHRMSVIGLAKSNAIIFKHSNYYPPLTKVQYGSTYKTVKAYSITLSNNTTEYYYEAYLDIFGVSTDISLSVPATERTEDRVFNFTISSGNTNFYIPIGKMNAGSFNINLSLTTPDPTSPANRFQRLSASIGVVYNYNSSSQQSTVSYSGTWASIVRITTIRNNNGVVYAFLSFHPSIFSYFEYPNIDVRVGVILNWLQATDVNESVLALPVQTNVAGTAATVVSSDVRGVAYSVSIPTSSSFVVPMYNQEEITYNVRTQSGTFSFSSYYLDNTISTFANTATNQIDRYYVWYSTPPPQNISFATIYFGTSSSVSIVGVSGTLTYMPLSAHGQGTAHPVQQGTTEITVTKNPSSGNRFFIYVSNQHTANRISYFLLVPNTQTQDFLNFNVNSTTSTAISPYLPVFTIRKL